MKRLSIVIPVYYNEKNIPVTYRALADELGKLEDSFEYEVVFVDDGSGDNSFEALLEVHRQDPGHVRVVKLSRNWGQVAATQAGFEHATGDAVIVMSADLQDDPALIHRFVQEWDQNRYDVVLAARTDREDDFLSRVTSRIFYSLMRRFAVRSMPPGGFDYFLLNRRVLDLVLQTNEKNTFLQGQVLWTGFRQKVLPYTRLKRTIGRSRWTFGKKLKYFIDGFMTYTYVPIRFISVTGIFIALLGFLYAAVIFMARLTTGLPVKGWAPLMIVVLVLSGFQMIMLGIIGEYLWRNYDETRKRPLFIVDRVVESEPPPPAS